MPPSIMHKAFFTGILLKYRLSALSICCIFFAGNTVLISALYPFVWNMCCASFSLYTVLIIILAILHLTVFLFTLFPAERTIERVNSLNPHLRNSIITAFELSRKDKLNPTEEEFLESAQLNSASVKTVPQYPLIQSVRYFLFSVIILLITLIIFPVFMTNMLGITDKEVVLKPRGGLHCISYNYGAVSGHIIDSRGNHYSEDNHYKPDDYVMFTGPGVMSNKLALRYVRSDIIDSITVIVSNPDYRGGGRDTVRSLSMTLPQYSTARAVVYSSFAGNDTVSVNNGQPIEKNHIESLRIMGDSAALTLGVEEDRYPLCEIDRDLMRGLDYQYIRIPVIAIDDIGIEYAGIEITENNEKRVLKEQNADSLFFLLFNSDSIRGRQIEVRAFAKDNNPFKEQISYSGIIRITADSSRIDVSRVADTVISPDFTNENSEVSQRVQNIKSALMRGDTETAEREFRETVEEMREFSSRTDSILRDISAMRVEKEILKHVYDMKKRIDRLDSDILEQITADMKMGRMKEMTEEELEDYIMDNTEEIEKALDSMDSMLDKLETLSDLSRIRKNLQTLIAREEDAINSEDSLFTRKQESITQTLERMDNAIEESRDMRDVKRDMQKAAEMSGQAEKDRAKAEEVKKQMEKMSSDILKQMGDMTGQSNIDINMVIASLYTMNKYLDSHSVNSSVRTFYSNLYASVTGDADMQSPLSAMISGVYRSLSSDQVKGDELINENFRIISYLLSPKDNPKGQGQSMEQMMNSMNSMTMKQEMIMQALKNMMQSGSGEKQMLDELARMQREMAGHMRRMSREQGSEKMLGDMESLADSLDDMSRQMETGGIDSNMVNKQNRLLNRMLDMTKSVYRKKISPERKSLPGGDYTIKSSIVLPEDLGFDRYYIRRQLFRYLDNYDNEKYRPLIRKYYMEIIE